MPKLDIVESQTALSDLAVMQAEQHAAHVSVRTQLLTDVDIAKRSMEALENTSRAIRESLQTLEAQLASMCSATGQMYKQAQNPHLADSFESWDSAEFPFEFGGILSSSAEQVHALLQELVESSVKLEGRLRVDHPCLNGLKHKELDVQRFEKLR